MRTISSALEATQQDRSCKPYVRIYLTSADGDTNYDYSSRLIQLEHVEEPYNDRATIILYNNDRGVADVRGYWLEIGYGHDCSEHAGGSQEYSSAPRLWVKSQQSTSREGKLFTILDCRGMWAALEEIDTVTKGDPPKYQTQYEDTYTIFGTINDLMGAIEFNGEWFYLEGPGDQDDGIIDTLTPMVWLNQHPFENPAAVMYRLIAMTKCFLRPKAGMKFKIIYPQESDSVDETYYSDKPHYFHEYVERLNIAIPNHIVVYANPGEDELWGDIITTEAEDTDSIDMYKDVTRHHIAMDLDNETDAQNRADAILSRVLAERLAGRLIVPHDNRVELYDRVAVYDAREGA